MKCAAALMLLLAFFGLAGGRVAAAVTTLYDTGFCFPNFSNAGLVGQDQWVSAQTNSVNAAQIVTCPAGLEMELFGPYIQYAAGSNLYDSLFTRTLSNYNPSASGNPIISVRAEVNMNLGPTAGSASKVFAFLALNDQYGTPFENIGIDKNGVVFGQNFNSPNQVVTAPTSGTNAFHIVRADLNFSTRQVTFYMDGAVMGSMPFNPGSSTLLGAVALVLQSSNPVDSNFFVDDLTVTAASSEASGDGCSIQITRSGPCLGNGTYGTPNVGDLYGVRADFSVTGTPNQPFRIKFTLGNVVWYIPYQSITAGSDWWYYLAWWVDLDGPLSWSITIDPDGVSGCTNLANMTVSGTFTPTPPSVPLEFYNPVIMAGTEQAYYSFQPGSGTIPFLHVILGSPTSHGAQQILSLTGPTNAQNIVTPPYGIPVFSANWTNVAAGLFQPSVSFVAQLSSMKVNPTLLRTNTWAQMSALPANITQWLAPDQMCQSTSPAISNFVSLYLPANYKTTMTPYDTARTLQLAVERSLVYLEPPPYADATNSLQAGVADCGGFASLFTAALRCAGIPARRIGGFWQCDTWQNYNNWHVRTESYFPNTGWVITDACEGNRADPTGTSSFDFCFAPDANFFCAMDVGDQHMLPYYNFVNLQVTGWWWGGGAEYLDEFDNSYLEPLCALTPLSAAKGSFNLSLTNLPIDGTISLLASTNLVIWSTVATTNAASITASSLQYSFPSTAGPQRFFRAAQSP